VHDLSILDSLEPLIKEVEAELVRQSSLAPWADQAAFLVQLPGIGVHNAMVLLAAIGDVRRFDAELALSHDVSRAAREHIILEQGRTVERWRSQSSGAAVGIAEPGVAACVARWRLNIQYGYESSRSRGPSSIGVRPSRSALDSRRNAAKAVIGDAAERLLSMMTTSALEILAELRITELRRAAELCLASLDKS